jgi:hypothetical protein
MLLHNLKVHHRVYKNLQLKESTIFSRLNFTFGDDVGLLGSDALKMGLAFLSKTPVLAYKSAHPQFHSAAT